MADYLVTDTELTSIANAIRTKGGTSASLSFPSGFSDAISAIPTGGSNNVQVTFSKTSPYISLNAYPNSASVDDTDPDNLVFTIPQDSMFVISANHRTAPTVTGDVTFSSIYSVTRPQVRYMYAVHTGQNGGTIRL